MAEPQSGTTSPLMAQAQIKKHKQDGCVFGFLRHCRKHKVCRETLACKPRVTLMKIWNIKLYIFCTGFHLVFYICVYSK